jgi:hypothetical protein
MAQHLDKHMLKQVQSTAFVMYNKRKSQDQRRGLRGNTTKAKSRKKKVLPEPIVSDETTRLSAGSSTETSENVSKP